MITSSQPANAYRKLQASQPASSCQLDELDELDELDGHDRARRTDEEALNFAVVAISQYLLVL